MFHYYTTCKTDLQPERRTAIVVDGALLKAKLKRFIDATGGKMHFTWFNTASEPDSRPDANTLAKALAYLSAAEVRVRQLSKH